MTYYHTKYGIRKRKKSKFHRFVIYTIIVLLLIALGGSYLLYRVVFHPNVWLDEKETKSIYIPTDSDFEDVKSILYSEGIIINRKNFEWLSGHKKYPDNIKPGHYILKSGMNNNELINLLRSGEQTPVNVIFNNIRTIEELASRVSKTLELDSAALVNTMNDTNRLNQLGLSRETSGIIFIPNTYEFYWNTSADEFVSRMFQEYVTFWNDTRTSLADSLGFTIPEVITLASIIEKETSRNEEKPIIAGVYLNRLKRGWLLQADPTVIYATGNFNMRRVLNEHKKIDSPYNTYKYGGLPPGPICMPSISSIDAVLYPDENDYLYFCAREDLSGYHNFAKTARQHYINARKYQKALDELKIYN